MISASIRLKGNRIKCLSTIIIGAFLALLVLGCGKSIAQREEEALLGSYHNPKISKEIQLILMYAGFDPKYTDGVIGPSTRRAVKDFQKHLNLPVSGYVSKKTWAEMEKRRGQAGPFTAVDIQFALRKAGFDPGAIDGKLGEKSRVQIAEFQSAKGLNVTRTINPETWSKLKVYAKNGQR